MSSNSFSETSENSLLETSIPNSFIDCKELSLLDNLIPVHGIASEVFQFENMYFTKSDWNIQDLDQPNDSIPSKSVERCHLEDHGTSENSSPCEFEKNLIWDEDYDFFQEGGEFLDMADTSNHSNEDELVSFFSFLKTDGDHRNVSKKIKHSHGASRNFLNKKMRHVDSGYQRRSGLLEKSGGLFDELENDDASCKVKGVLFMKQDPDVFVQKSSYRVAGGPHHYKKRSRRFPVDRSTLLRSVLTKNVHISVL